MLIRDENVGVSYLRRHAMVCAMRQKTRGSSIRHYGMAREDVPDTRGNVVGDPPIILSAGANGCRQQFLMRANF